MPEQNIQNIIESLSPNERKIIPYLKQGSLDKIKEPCNPAFNKNGRS